MIFLQLKLDQLMRNTMVQALIFLDSTLIRELSFWLTTLASVVADHLNTSKAQYLGNSRPKSYYRNYTNDIYESFVYTPCMIGELNKGSSTMKEN